MSQHEKALAKLITDTAYMHSVWDVFQDFLAMSAAAISNTVDLRHREEREADYLRIVGKYERRYLDNFPRMLAELTAAMEEEPGDILGRIYGDLGLANKWTGQFFTPDDLCRMMAEMQIGDMKEKIAEKGFITVSDPAIGGGALIINLALALRTAGVNYQHSICVTGVDIDIKAIHMSYLQLSLLHVPAVLIHGNSLTLQEHSHWYTPAYILGGWAWRRQRGPREAVEVPPAAGSKAKYEAISLFEVI